MPKQWDSFLNYWTRTLGTELICKSMLTGPTLGVYERSGAAAVSRCGRRQSESLFMTQFDHTNYT